MGQQGGLTGMLLPLAMFAAIFYFMIIRPQKKKQKAHEDMLASISKGDTVITAGGFFGVVRETLDDSYIVELDEGVKARILKSSVSMKKSDGNMSIELERTDDILAWLGAHRREGQVLCGFSMETQNMLENSRAKLEKKHVDMIVANSLRAAGAGFGTDTNIVTVITKDGAEELALMSKDRVAHELLNRIFAKKH